MRPTEDILWLTGAILLDNTPTRYIVFIKKKNKKF